MGGGVGPVLLAIRVQPGAKKQRAVRENGRLKVFVPQAAQESKANKAVIEMVAKALGLSKSRVVLQHGERARDKTLALHGWSGSAAQAEEAIAARWG